MTITIVPAEQPESSGKPEVQELRPCDYLVVGAGAMALAFIDTLLLQDAAATVVVVDKHPIPSGQWQDAYDFVKLHQPSFVYGVESEKLEGNWCCSLLKLTKPWNQRATKAELVAYFDRAMRRWVSTGRVRYFPCSEYDFEAAGEQAQGGMEHLFRKMAVAGGKEIVYKVLVHEKLVNTTWGEPVVPSKSPLKFPVATKLHVVTPNQIYVEASRQRLAGKQRPLVIVLGCGKTACDTVVYLQEQGFDPEKDIVWIAPNDIWFINREYGESPGYVTQAVIDAEGDLEKAADALEKEGFLLRMDPKIRPTKWRFPTIDKRELNLIRNVKHVVRRGRVRSVEVTTENQVRMEFEGGDPLLVQHDLQLQREVDVNNILVVHCTSPGPFMGNMGPKRIFESKHVMHTHPIFLPPVCLSASCIAFMEAKRRQNKIDVGMARKILEAVGNVGELADDAAVVERALHHTFCPLDVMKPQDLCPVLNEAWFLGLVDPESTWYRKNRLNMLSLMGSIGIVEKLEKLVAKPEKFPLTQEMVASMKLVTEERLLEFLRGK